MEAVAMTLSSAGRATGPLLVLAALALLAHAWTLAPAVAQAPVPIRVLLDWRFDGSAAPFLVAEDKGYFRAEGLDVTIEPGGGSRETVAKLAAGAYQLGVGDVNTLIRYRDENPGTDLTAVLMMQDAPPFAIIGRKSRGVTADPNSLVGKVLGASSADGAAAQWPVFKALTRIEPRGARIEIVGQAVREPMLASGELDGVFGSAVSTLVTLKSRGVPADDLIVLAMSDYGLELYGDALIANNGFAAQHPAAVQGFIRALVRGMQDAVTDPEGAVQAVLRRNEQARREVELDRLRLGIARNVFTPWVKEQGWGGIDPARFARAIDQIGLAFTFKSKPKPQDIFTEVFLPPPADRQID
jgi:NitT/TauT family transport system substrate-binding protein